MKFKVVVREDREDPGWYNVSCPSLPGCHSQGRTVEEALMNIKEAIELYLEPEEDVGISGKGVQLVEVEV